MEKNNRVVPIVIPTFEPDERFLHILSELLSQNIGPIVIVDDGSGKDYQHFFETAKTVYHTDVLTHEVNMGKGRALKSAFLYCLQKWPHLAGCVTADSDGQHTPQAILRCKQGLLDNPSSLVLGARNFFTDTEGKIPAKSMYGNRLTCKVLYVLHGIDISDTQTGLRGIPANFMLKLLDVKGERFEFETQMLIEAKAEGVPIIEVPIETIYDSKENHSTHFNPILDSIRIYRSLGEGFGRFLISSFSSALIDLGLFWVLCNLMRGNALAQGGYIIIATVCARFISAAYNYSVNYFFVFKSRQGHMKSVARYIFLAVTQMLCSAALTTWFFQLLSVRAELMIKIPVDVGLFLLSYIIQRKWVY